MALTCEEVNANLNEALGNALVGTAEKFKGYVDVKVDDAKSELKEQIVSELSNVDGLGAQLEKIQEMADNFSKVFDEDKDGKITPEEILAKAVLLQQAIDGVNAKIDVLTANIGDVKTACEKEVNEAKKRLDALELKAEQNRSDITNIKAELSTNVITKDYVECAFKIDIDSLISKVNNVFTTKDSKESDKKTTNESSESDGSVE